ncbi:MULTISPECIES: hypothetical protein [Brevibacillus]|jgi:hypothetical protein|uniref:Uncharacterized protein n=1 Tax=Brevibacillus borstelensis AK1 TaxID=1300222 RepID=M8DDR5_9BACL|nr:hypothetical protein [Brevibacillus borstelensis]EMT54469.1 hypothetical protein I532_02655 [Brevibacillus borstelensis AK1]KKX54426.1 hypothetical protein X546_15480 [Brevibacillus borstelensis cifa_chp40]MCC0567374.1 hypothetical protein [Brevibacillus borstelensis]MCM3473582.1 hypothetical protein [Brevibacillus borstelensis]MCM3561840.1 hypothetical protein [Brevibacillus borstelensis]
MKLSTREWVTPVVSGAIVWLLVTLFFRYFGHHVLVSVTHDLFFPVFLGLEAVTAIALYLVGLSYHLIDPSKYGLVRFGMLGTAVGLMLDSISLSNHTLFFPHMSDEQVLSFSVWVVFAYGLYILIPAWQNTLALARRKG